MFVVHRSNRAENLVEVLAELVRSPLADPFARECIVVQGRGMERWLAMELSKRLGVWANPDFPFPRRMVDRALEAVLGPEPASALFEPETMKWSIADLLAERAAEHGFESIGGYLSGDDRGAKRIQLAERIADTFDHYAVYRPEMLLGWQDAPSSDWQAVLWRALVEKHGPHHVAARAALFRAALESGGAPTDFPERLSLFGTSTLPPLYVDVLAGLGRFVDLHLFVLSPSALYWGDLRSRRAQLRRGAVDLGNVPVETRTSPGWSGDPMNAFAQGTTNQPLGIDVRWQEGNALLSSLGRLGRDFQRVLEERVDYHEEAADLYVDPGGRTVLAALQSNILHLRAGAGEGAEERPPDDDRSVTVHSCHGPMRELEVLHDQLLALFEEDRGLEAHDVVVMTPSIESYAPYIDAVFAAPGSESARIPYRVADRGPRATDEVVDAFDAILRALPGRLGAPEVLDLLVFAAVRERFGIAPEQLDRVRRWVVEAGIRWGVDEAHRDAAGQPRERQNTWRFGLDRLLVGYAMPGEERECFAGVLPHDDVEGTGAALLGKLAELCETLFAFRERLAEPRPLDRWRDDLIALLAAATAADGERVYQRRRIAQALEVLAERASRASFAAPVALDTVRAEIVAELERSRSAHGFLSGGVTFCELVPMRSIPFRVVCLIGMNDDAFPRSRRPLGFDLIAEGPRPGDRSPRDDDRYLFLEALLSARRNLIVTYVGQSIHDNGKRPPSVVVSELLDAIDESFGAGVRQRVVVEHPLQPFSPRYFARGGDQRLFSFAGGYGLGARRAREARTRRPAFLDGPLPEGDDGAAAIDVDELLRFLEHPTRFFLQRRLGLYLGDDAEVVPAREPLFLAGLERWQIGDWLLDRLRRDEPVDRALELLGAKGVLPFGALGRFELASVKLAAEGIAVESSRRTGAGNRIAAVPIDLALGAARLTGALRDVWPAAQVLVSFSRLRAKHDLRVWVRHLALCALTGGKAVSSLVVGRAAQGDRPEVRVFRPAAEPLPILRQLLELHRVGRTVPVPFFIDASRAYAVALRDGEGRTKALEKAARVFDGNGRDNSFAEMIDPYVRQAYGDVGSLQEVASVPGAPGFEDTASLVWGTLLDHVVEEAP